MTSSSGSAIPEPVSAILENFADMAQYLTDVAAVDPLSAAMLAIGNVLMLVSLGLFGYLTVRALVDIVIPGPAGAQHRHG